MEDTIERILSHPLLMVTLSLFCLLLVFAILKKTIEINSLLLGFNFSTSDMCTIFKINISSRCRYARGGKSQGRNSKLGSGGFEY